MKLEVGRMEGECEMRNVNRWKVYNGLFAKWICVYGEQAVEFPGVKRSTRIERVNVMKSEDNKNEKIGYSTRRTKQKKR